MKRSIEPILLAWKQQKIHKPLIIRGARQVGKSTLIEKFGREHFENTVTVNLDLDPGAKRCFEDLNPKNNLAQLSALSGQPITPGKTLLFIDEIQESVNAIKALRYYKEKIPELHVIAAGSLLEFVLNEEAFSFPVGRVQFLQLYPLSFMEYLSAKNNQSLINYIEQADLNNPIPEVIHEKLLKEVRHYFLIGGMPEVLQQFLDESDPLQSQLFQSSIIDTYQRDFSKYASKAETKVLQKVFLRVPQVIARQFKYVDIDRETRARELKRAVTLLDWAGLLHPIKATSAAGIPLSFHAMEDKFKLLFLDIGLLQRATKVDLVDMLNEPLLQINRGVLAEQFVGQELLANHSAHEVKNVFYWERDKRGSTAEVDYVVDVENVIIPIEVKAGKTGSLRSLKQFMEEKNISTGVRVSAQPLYFEHNILSLPFYLLSQLERLLKSL